MTVARKPGSGHKSAKETVKTIARGMPVETGVTVVTTLVCFFILHARLRVHRAPGIPHALFGRKFQVQPGRNPPRDGEGVFEFEPSLRGATGLA
jgi:hypothetical protein